MRLSPNGIYPDDSPATSIEQGKKENISLISTGTIRPILDSTFPLDDVAAAYEHARSGRATGKVAVTLR